MEKATQWIIAGLLFAILIVLGIDINLQSRQLVLMQPSPECRQARAEMLGLIQKSNEEIGQIQGLLTQMPKISTEGTISLFQTAQLGILSQMAANNASIVRTNKLSRAEVINSARVVNQSL